MRSRPRSPQTNRGIPTLIEYPFALRTSHLFFCLSGLRSATKPSASRHLALDSQPSLQPDPEVGKRNALRLINETMLRGIRSAFSTQTDSIAVNVRLVRRQSSRLVQQDRRGAGPFRYSGRLILRLLYPLVIHYLSSNFLQL